MWCTTMNLLFTLYFNLNNSNNAIAKFIHVLRPFLKPSLCHRKARNIYNFKVKEKPLTLIYNNNKLNINETV